MTATEPRVGRSEILDRLRRSLGEDSSGSRLDRRRVFCIACGNEIAPPPTPGATALVCPRRSCGARSERAFIFEPAMRWRFNAGSFREAPVGELIHETVGAIVERRGRCLLFRRRLFPVGEYTLPAGHREGDESPEACVRREMAEEVGLEPRSLRLLAENVLLRDACRRGADYHLWTLFGAETAGEPSLGEEGDRWGWYGTEEWAALPLTPPTRHFLLREAPAPPSLNPGARGRP